MENTKVELLRVLKECNENLNQIDEFKLDMSVHELEAWISVLQTRVQIVQATVSVLEMADPDDSYGKIW